MKKFNFIIVIAVVLIIVVAIIILNLQYRGFDVITYIPPTNVEKNNDTIITSIIRLQDFDIVFYGNDKFYLNYNGKKVELKESLINRSININQLLVQAEEDFKNKIVSKNEYLDGGSIEYIYENFRIIKMNSLNGNKNLYIMPIEFDINDI